MDKKRIIVTGINGFVGHHLASELHKNNVAVIGIGRDSKLDPELTKIVDEYYSLNLVDGWPIINNIDAIIHLAGLAAVGPSFDNPQLYINSNSAMVTHMCEYYLKQNKKPRILVVSTGAVYDSDQSMPLNEESRIGFASPYAISKILTENQCAYYRGRGLDCVIARPFNHIGPGQSQGFILPDFFDRLSHLNDNTSTLQVGNINTRRDYTDVRDIVTAYTKIILAPDLKHDTYNIGSGKSLSGSEILDLLKIAVNKPNVTFEIDQSLVRPTDVMEVVGDASRIENELGWKPHFDIKDTIADFVASAKGSN